MSGGAAGGDDARGRLLRAVNRDVADDDPAAFRPEPGSRRGADAGGAADHDRNPFGKAAQSHGY
jgi:hypothetical protein